MRTGRGLPTAKTAGTADSISMRFVSESKGETVWISRSCEQTPFSLALHGRRTSSIPVRVRGVAVGNRRKC